MEAIGFFLKQHQSNQSSFERQRNRAEQKMEKRYENILKQSQIMAANAYSIPIRVQGQPTGAELKSISNFNNNMWQSMETQHCNQSEWQMSRMVHEETIAWKLVKKTDPNKFLMGIMHAPLVLQSGIAVTEFFQQIICHHMDKVHHMLNVTSEAICPLSLAARNCGSVRKTVQSTYSVDWSSFTQSR